LTLNLAKIPHEFVEMEGPNQILTHTKNLGYLCFAMDIDIAQIKRQTESIYTVSESQNRTMSIQ